MTLKVYQAIQDQVLQPFQDFAANGASQISTEIGRTLQNRPNCSLVSSTRRIYRSYFISEDVLC